MISTFNTAYAEKAISEQNSEKPLIYIHIDDTPAPTDAVKNHMEDSTISVTPEKPQKKKRTDKFKKLVAEIYKFFLTPFIIDRLYPEGELNNNITGALKQLYPTASQTQLNYISKYTKAFLSLKRRYDYVVNRLEQRIKAAKLLPQDAPIVAKDGEFAPEFPEERKQSDADEYNVKYNPYKYIGYDAGELGEPVRRRDKNYQEKITNLDEITLAILKFDIPAFFKAVDKLPRSTDNSAEKPVKLANGVEARLLMAQSSPGNNPKLRAVIEVYIPEGHYITADFLNPRTRPHFFLSEDKAANENISGYELFLPEANGVVKDGVAKRILTRTVRYPIEFTRKDVDKPTTIKGKFAFELCDKAGNCAPAVTEHEFTVRPSLDEELSIYYNYVTQGFTHLPPEKSKHAELTGATYDAENNTLSLTFATTRAFSQVAVMAEDAVGTNFINPRYRITDNEITATFDITPSPHTPHSHCEAATSVAPTEAIHKPVRSTPHSHCEAATSVAPTEAIHKPVRSTPHSHCEVATSVAPTEAIHRQNAKRCQPTKDCHVGHCPPRNDATEAPLAVTAMFDNRENLRTVTTPHGHFPPPSEGEGQGEGEANHPYDSLALEEDSSFSSLPPRRGRTGEGEANHPYLSIPSPLVKNPSLTPPQPSSLQVALPLRLAPLQYYAYGLLLTLMPGIFYLFIRLVALFWSRKERARIFLRYILGTTLGWTILAYCFEGHYWSKIYETPILTALSLSVVVSFLSECMGYMDFALFRPLRGKLRRGFLIGLFSPLLITACPMIMSAEVLSSLFSLPADMALGKYAALLAGMFTLPLIAFLFPQDKPLFFRAMRELNIVYNLIYLAGALWLIAALRGETAFWLTLLSLALIWGLWKIYPTAIAETVKHTKVPTREKLLFHKVQRHAFAAITLLTGLTYAVIALSPLPTPKRDIPTPVAVMTQLKTDTTPILVTLTAPWSVSGSINIPYLKKLEREGIKTIEIKAIGEAEAAAPWFATYDKRHAPLNVLFTTRHPYGLVLPDDLTKIDWQEALAVFTNETPTATPAERNKEND